MGCLFFDADFDEHAKEIYDDPNWPKKPLFYLSCPSITDDTVAPKGNENLMFLIHNSCTFLLLKMCDM